MKISVNVAIYILLYKSVLKASKPIYETTTKTICETTVVPGTYEYEYRILVQHVSHLSVLGSFLRYIGHTGS